MQTLRDQRVIVTGGHSGLGLGFVEALVERGARVVVVARDHAKLAAVERRLGVTTVVGDVTDRALAGRLLRELQPHVVALNAGGKPEMLPLHEHTWESFTAVWDNDVKQGLHWVQEALRAPLAAGSRILISSSGAAVGGSPLSGGYAGAKRMLWLMANYANGISAAQGLGLRFQAIVPMQVVGETPLGREIADAYAAHRGISREAFLAGFGPAMSPRRYGEHLVEILTDPQHDAAGAFALRGDDGIKHLDGAAP